MLILGVGILVVVHLFLIITTIQLCVRMVEKELKSFDGSFHRKLEEVCKIPSGKERDARVLEVLDEEK